jgi:nucleoside-diphosphate-sugar epimerase
LILVTGSSGLIGRHLCSRLEAEGREIRRFDMRGNPAEDIRDRSVLRNALRNAIGVVHLAAVSRVVWAEQDPALCQATNVDAVKILTELCLEERPRPWLIFASSREVHGNPLRLPVREDDAQAPVNVYGRSKRDAEAIIGAAREAGLLANICRFTNVYGCPFDHQDRVAMAFARVAARGGSMFVEGSEHTFDFTEVGDVADGIWRLIQESTANQKLPPIHFASGQGTKLRELARMAAARALCPVEIVNTEPRSFDVSAFVGDPSRAMRLLGWQTRTSLGDGLSRLIANLSEVRSTFEATAQHRAGLT